MFKYLIYILFFIPTFAFSQVATDYYHDGANLYINGKKREAKAKVMEGILKYPEDGNLKQLAALIKEDEEKEKQKMDQQQKENQDKQDQDKEEQDQDKKDQEGDKNEEDQKKNDQEQDENKDDENKEKEDEQPRQVQVKISEEDAKRLLKALEQEEKEVQKKVNEEKVKGQKVRVEKDW